MAGDTVARSVNKFIYIRVGDKSNGFIRHKTNPKRCGQCRDITTRQQKMKLRPIIITLTIWFASCNECKEFDCFQTFPEISFHYLSNSNEDLLDGPTKKYNLTDFELFSIDELNNKYISDLRFTGQFSGQNAFITATIKNDISRNYLKVKGQLTDTLDFQFRLNIATECCGESLIITTTSLNNQTVDSYHILTLKERN